MGFFDEPFDERITAEGRVEARAKVTGNGKYAAEYEVEGVCYAVLVDSTVPAGTIKSIDTSQASLVDGVIDIISHLHRPLVPGFADEEKIKQSRFSYPIFHTDKVYFNGQPIALVIADTLENATYAASLVTATYDKESFKVDFYKEAGSADLRSEGKERGSMDAWKESPHYTEGEFTIAAEVHNPMEMHATIAEWVAEDKLRLFDKNQGVNNVQRTFARLYNIPQENIEVFSEFVGGGFGSGLRVWPHALAAIMAAKQVKRAVKLMLTRPQMFYSVGYRPASWQYVKMGADAGGKISGVLHQAKNESSVYENFGEGITRVTRLIYDIPNLKTESGIVPLNLSTPTWMRGPGDCTGDFAIESCIDELSYKLNMDPVAFRLKNLALEKHPDNGMPWSTNFINECIEKGAAMINWKERPSKPGQLKNGDWYTGYGMAIGMWGAGRGTASAGIEMRKDGSVTVTTAMTDIGTGTGTAMLNMVHTATGIPKEKITVELGNSNLPPAPSQGGSTGLSSISGAVAAAVKELKRKLLEYAVKADKTYEGVDHEAMVIFDKGIAPQLAYSKLLSFDIIWEKNSLDTIAVEASSGPGEERRQYAFCSGAAHFCKVRVNTKTGKVKMERMVCVADGGKIVNEKAAANQISGAAVGGIGMALMEQQQADARLGNLVGSDFAGYHFAVNADAPIIEVAFIGKPDPNINPSGAKGLGEVGIIGCAAAITNAIYNATGKRLRDLPVTPDKVVG